MQLDKTRIPILERGYDNLLDLTLVVVRRHALPLLVTSLLGAAPFAVLNYFLLASWLQALESYDYALSAAQYALVMALLVCAEAPLASIATTLYLGEALFVEKPDLKRMWQNFTAAWPQLVAVQGLFRAVLIGLVFLPAEGPVWLLRVLCIGAWILLYWFRPYLNEIILLERNPWRGGPGVMTTRRRAATLHGHFAGNLFGALAGGRQLRLAVDGGPGRGHLLGPHDRDQRRAGFQPAAVRDLAARGPVDRGQLL